MVLMAVSMLTAVLVLIPPKNTRPPAIKHEQRKHQRMSIYGIGTDLCSINRIAHAAESARFAQKILHPQEYALYQQRQLRNPQQGLRFIASRFAAKEALSKAMGTGFRAPMAWHTCSILPATDGRPVLTCYGSLLAWMTERGLHAQLSLSDEVEYCLAFCILEHKKQ